MAPDVAFSALLKQFRVSSGLTQEALAERAGLSGRAISALERGVNRTPRRDTLDRLASALALPARKRARLLAAVYPEVEHANTTPTGWQSLPRPSTPLVGREREVDAVVELIRRPEVRLVTLTGPAGVGKTRLAVHVLEDLAEAFDDGICFVELGDVRDAANVAPTIAQTLTLRETAGHSVADRLMSYVASKHLLLALDNFEHLEPAAPLVRQLLEAGPRIKLLVTSRARLRLRAEHEYVVPPLALPDTGGSRRPGNVEHLLRYPAVELFALRARAAGSTRAPTAANLTAMVEICRRLDGLPLAIELAAARIKVLPPAALLEHLDRQLPTLTGGAIDLPDRQRTMRSAIGWSYELLGPREQAVFRALAVCAGGCTVEAAEAIAGRESESPHELLDAITLLVDHSLLSAREDAAGEPRLSYLEVIREYGLERLAESSEDEQSRARHARYFLQLAEAASAHLIGSPQQGSWLQRLEQDRGNLLAALDWAAKHGDNQLGLRLVAALGPFWYFRGYISEGRHWIDTFLTATASDPDLPSSRLWLLYGAGKLALEQGDYARVHDVADQALALAEALDHSLGMSEALELQGCLARVRGDPLGARALLEQALLCARRADDRVAIERVLFWLGHAARESGDLVRAELAFEELLMASRQGPLHGTALLLLSLGHVARERLDDKRAATRYREALEVFATIGDPSGLAACFEGLSGLARQRGDMQRTARLAAAASGLRESAASALTPAERHVFDEDLAAARAALGDATFATLWTEGRALPLDDAVTYAREPQDLVREETE